MKNITVTWFDQLKGIGEGTNNQGHPVFLNSLYIINDGRFKTLIKGEKVKALIKPNKRGGHFALNITRRIA